MDNEAPRFRDRLDDQVKADLDEHGPSSIGELAARTGRAHGVIAAAIGRLVDDGILYRAAIRPALGWQRPKAPIYWYAPPPRLPRRQTTRPRRASPPPGATTASSASRSSSPGRQPTARDETRAA